MRVLSLSWQRSLAAVAVAAFLGSGAPAAPAAEHADPPKAVAPKEERREGPHARKPDEPRRGDAERADREWPKHEREKPDRPRGEREGRPRIEWTPHQRELMERRIDLQREARELQAELSRARPDSDDARELREDLAEVHREIEEISRQLPPGRFAGPMPEGPMGRDMPPEERERRMRHLRVAAENLHAAGMHDLADRLLREAEHGPGPMGPEGPRPPMIEGPGPSPNFAPMMRELTDQIQQLRREIEELREQVHRIEAERR